MSTELFLGSLEIGVLISSVIYGVTCLQCYLYFVEYSTKDSLFLKSFVAVLMATETFHAALLAHALYIYSVKNFGNVNKLYDMIWSLLLQIFIATILSTATQLFFAFRIYRLSDRFRRVIPCIIFALSMTALGLSLCFVINGLKAPSWSFANTARGTLPSLGSVITFLSAICDSLIAVTIIYLLRVHGRRSPLARTSRMINRLIWYTLNTGLLTTIFALVAGITLAVCNNSVVSMSFHFISTRLYMCSLVSSLNSRETVQKELEGDSGITDDRTDNITANDAVFTTGGFELTQMACGTTIDSASQLHIYQESNDVKFSGLDHD